MHDTVDILLATYNGAAYVADQLESILNQTHQNIRLLIRDDASKDETLKILQIYANQHPSKIILLPTDRQMGVKSNFSLLLSQSHGEYIMLADQDDVWDKNKIALSLAKIKQMQAAVPQDTPLLVHTDLKVVDQHLNLIAPSFWRYAHLYPARAHGLNRLLAQNVVTGCTVMFNRTLATLAYPIPDDVVMHDWWLALVAAALGHIDTVPQTTMLYRQHASNTLGAKKFISLANFRQGFQKLRQNESSKKIQANKLLQRYAGQLSPSQHELIAAFLKSTHASYFHRIHLIFKYRLFKCGFMRNMANLFFKFS